MRHVEQVLRYAEQVLREEVGRLYDASSELLVRQGAADDAVVEPDEPPGTTQRQAHVARVVERLLVARRVLDVVESLEVDRDLQSDLAILD